MQCRLPDATFCNFTDAFVFSDKKENPLALLGQYSDDEEEDEEAADQPNGETKGSSTDASAQVIQVLTLSSLVPSLGLSSTWAYGLLEAEARPNRLIHLVGLIIEA